VIPNRGHTKGRKLSSKHMRQSFRSRGRRPCSEGCRSHLLHDPDRRRVL